MTWTLSRIAQTLELQLKGEDRQVQGINTLELATENDISFLANPKYAHFLPHTKACAVIVSAEHAELIPRALISTNPYVDFGRAAALFAKKQGDFTGISPQSRVDPSATVGEGCTVYPFVYVAAGARIGRGSTLFPGCYIGENCVVGEDSILYPHVVLMASTRLGSRCIVHSGVVLGADGFGFARTTGGVQKIPQIGTVFIDDDVEIGANTAIDRAALGVTRIGKHTKIDNLVQIGHNVTLGEGCFIVSQVGISGSTTVGDRVTMAGQVGVAGHLAIGNDVTIGPKSGVAKDIPDNQTCGGSPCVDGKTFLRTIAVMPKLPEMHKRLGRLEAEIEALKKQLSDAAKEQQ